MRLRVRYEGKAYTIKGITDVTTLAELKVMLLSYAHSSTLLARPKVFG